MSNFICPVCGSGMIANKAGLTCENNHRFDRAKSGYVNLLLSQKTKKKQHGDDKGMIKARRAFLDKGFYMPLVREIISVLNEQTEDGAKILDAGCGECWYTQKIAETLSENRTKSEIFGVDISKDALAIGSKRDSNIELAVASVFRLPVKDGYCDGVLNLFAPVSTKEFARVLKKGGILLRVVPLQRHLWELKEAVYEHPYENDADDLSLEGFSLKEHRELRDMIRLSSNEDIENLFAMTPYFYKTAKEDREKLQSLSRLDTRIEFCVLIYQKL